MVRAARARARQAVGDRIAELTRASWSMIWGGFTSPTQRSSGSTRARASAPCRSSRRAATTVALYVAFWCAFHVPSTAGRSSSRTPRPRLPRAREAAALAPFTSTGRSLAAGEVVGARPRPRSSSPGSTRTSRTASGRTTALQLHRAGALAMAGATDEAGDLLATLRYELRETGGGFTELAMTASRARVSCSGWPATPRRPSASWPRPALSRGARERRCSRPRRRSARLRSRARSPSGADTWAATGVRARGGGRHVHPAPGSARRALLSSSRREDEHAERQHARPGAALNDRPPPEQGRHTRRSRGVLARAGRRRARPQLAYEQAAASTRRKGDVVSERRVRELLANSSAALSVSSL